jgi:hypothetical protein
MPGQQTSLFGQFLAAKLLKTQPDLSVFYDHGKLKHANVGKIYARVGEVPGSASNLAEVHDMGLGDLLEGIVLHSFEGQPPFNTAGIQKIEQLKAVYGLDYDASAAHHFTEEDPHA